MSDELTARRRAQQATSLVFERVGAQRSFGGDGSQLGVGGRGGEEVREARRCFAPSELDGRIRDHARPGLDQVQELRTLQRYLDHRAHAHAASTSPVHRGLAVLRELLCVEIPPPPAEVDPVLEPPDPAPATMRERLTVATQAAACRSCHDDINPLGFAFEHYDAVGKWQDTDNGLAVDTSGVLTKTDAAGSFADAIELLKRIADSDDAKACFVGHWLAQAYRRPAEAGDGCAVEQLSQAFADSDGDLVELMVSLAKSDNFRYRLKSELTP